METCTARPWPHRRRVSDTIVERFPHPFMLCDDGPGEDGRGRAGTPAIVRGFGRRVSFVPKSVLVQRQEELREVHPQRPRYDGKSP
jgi:hypothetical protein